MLPASGKGPPGPVGLATFGTRWRPWDTVVGEPIYRLNNWGWIIGIEQEPKRAGDVLG